MSTACLSLIVVAYSIVWPFCFLCNITSIYIAYIYSSILYIVISRSDRISQLPFKRLICWLCFVPCHIYFFRGPWLCIYSKLSPIFTPTSLPVPSPFSTSWFSFCATSSFIIFQCDKQIKRSQNTLICCHLSALDVVVIVFLLPLVFCGSFLKLI